MTLDKDAVTTINATTTIAKEWLDAARYTKQKPFKKLAVLIEFGLVLRTAVGFANADSGDPVLDRIEELKDTIDKVDLKMKEHFADLKAFVTELGFYEDVPLAAAILNKFFLDVLRYPGRQSRDRFRKEYKKLTPLEMARRLNHQLLRSTTNPLTMAMAASHDKQATFQKWNNVLDGVFTHLVVLEAYSCGLLHDKDEFYLNRTEEEHQRFEKTIAKWSEQYHVVQYLWPTAILKFVHQVQDDDELKDHKAKANAIYKMLGQIRTDHEFGVIVFDSRATRLLVVGLEDQLIQSFNRNGCCVIVFRSFHQHLKLKERSRFEHVVNQCAKSLRQKSKGKHLTEERLKIWGCFLKPAVFFLVLRTEDRNMVSFLPEDNSSALLRFQTRQAIVGSGIQYAYLFSGYH